GRAGEPARLRIRRVLAVAGTVAHVAGASVPIFRARGTRRVEAARRGATVAGIRVPVLAVLARIEHAVRALRTGHGARQAATAGNSRERLAVAGPGHGDRAWCLAEVLQDPGGDEGARRRVHSAREAERVRGPERARARDRDRRPGLHEGERARGVE